MLYCIIRFMNIIKRIRTEIFGVGQREFAGLVRVDQATICRWENGGSDIRLTEMHNIRDAAHERGIKWRDEWFFPPRKKGRTT